MRDEVGSCHHVLIRGWVSNIVDLIAVHRQSALHFGGSCHLQVSADDGRAGLRVRTFDVGYTFDRTAGVLQHEGVRRWIDCGLNAFSDDLHIATFA